MKRIIGASMLDADSNLSKVGCFQIIQDAITELMGDLGIDGFTIKEKYGAFWVFTKTRAKFIKTIAWKDEITVSSFISYISAAKMNMDVEIKDKFGKVAAYSRTELCALDIKTQRIMKLSSLGVDNSMLVDSKPPEIAFTKFAGSDLLPFGTVQIKYTNIDFSRHTNNTEYIRLIMDTYSIDEMKSKQITEMEIIYSSQSHEHDVLQIRKGTDENKDLIILEKDGSPVVKCEIIYKKDNL